MKKHSPAWCLFAGVPFAVPAPLARRGRAFRRVCAVPEAAVRCAGLPLGAHHHVGAAANHALASPATVLVAKALGFRGGRAARHGAQFPLPSTAVFLAMQISRVCVGGTPFKLAGFASAMLGTDATCSCKSGAACLVAHFLAATAVRAAPASSLDGSGALVERAGPKCTMFTANPASFSNVAATFRRARHCLTVVFCALPSRSDGVVDARVRCAISIGAVLEADKLAKDLRGVAVWIGAGQLHHVLAAQATFLPSGSGATFTDTLPSCAMFGAQSPCLRLGGAAITKTPPSCAVFLAQPPCLRLGGAAIDRARLPAVCGTKTSAADFVGAPIH